MTTAIEQLALGLQLGCPLGSCQSLDVVAPEGGYTAGQLAKVEDTVGVIYANTDEGDTATLIYRAENVTVECVAAPTAGYAVGEVMWLNASTLKLTNVANPNYFPCAVVKEAAVLGATSVEVSLDGLAMPALWAAIAALT